MEPAEASPDISRTSVILSVTLLAAYTAVVAWVAYDMAMSWPHEGSRTVLTRAGRDAAALWVSWWSPGRDLR